MNGIHDMGGMDGFGPVVVEANEPVFHAEWERRTFGLMLALGGNLDEARQTIESASPEEYLRLGYYGRWLRALGILLERYGILAPGELEGRLAGERRPAAPLPALPPPGPPGSFRKLDRRPRFAAGDRIRARQMNPKGHTRLPRYVRGHVGHVLVVQPPAVFPDAHAHGEGENPQHLYAVRFDGRELWGPDAEPGTSVTIDLFEPYLEAA